MQKYSCEKGDLYLADGADELHAGPDYFMESVLDEILKSREEYQKYIQLWGKLRGVERIALLVAHGDFNNKKWFYVDGNKESPVSRWITSVDGQYSGLILCVCNPGSVVPHSRKSVLVYGDDTLRFGALAFYEGTASINMFIPRKGVFDEYTLGSEIGPLERKLRE